MEVAEKLGKKFAAEDLRENDPLARQQALDQMGELGWELVGTHRNDQDRLVLVFKRDR